jgi:hypothetical protein
MRFDTDANFLITRLTPEPLKRIVPVVLEEGGSSCCTEEAQPGNLDIMPACQNSDNIIRVPVQINSAPNPVRAMGFDVVIDSEEALEFLGIEVVEDESLIDTWWNDGSDDTKMYHYGANLIEENGVQKVRVGAYAYNQADGAISQDYIPMGAIGNICHLLFRTPTTQCIRFTLENLKDDVSDGWVATGGCVQGDGAGSNGDVDNNGELTPRDALCAFQRAVNDDDSTDCGTCTVGLCDVTGDCECTADDPLCILNAYLMMVEDECANRLINGMTGI